MCVRDTQILSHILEGSQFSDLVLVTTVKIYVYCEDKITEGDKCHMYISTGFYVLVRYLLCYIYRKPQCLVVVRIACDIKVTLTLICYHILWDDMDKCCSNILCK